MSTDASPLFQPFTLGDLVLPNRIVMAPMTRSKSPNGVPGNDVADYYANGGGIKFDFSVDPDASSSATGL